MKAASIIDATLRVALSSTKNSTDAVCFAWYSSSTSASSQWETCWNDKGGLLKNYNSIYTLIYVDKITKECKCIKDPRTDLRIQNTFCELKNYSQFREILQKVYAYWVIEGDALILQHGDRYILTPGRGVTRPTQENLILRWWFCCKYIKSYLKYFYYKILKRISTSTM